MIHHIVLTGAPASGKTIFFERLKKEELTKQFIYFDELARQLLESNPDYRKNWKQLHIDIYSQQVARENNHLGSPFITDRGTIDAFAFHPETVKDVGTTIEDEYERYTSVILLESSANLGEEFYKKDTIRIETIDDTLFIENKLKAVWANHPGYNVINAFPSIEQKYSEFIRLLSGIIADDNI